MDRTNGGQGRLFAGMLAVLMSVMFLGTGLGVLAVASVPDADHPRAASPDTRAGQCAGDIEYVIITTDALKDSFEPLARWKSDKGVLAAVFTTEEIALDHTGDGPKRIHDLLVELKEASPGLQWVLIGGDSDVVPVRSLYAGAASYSDEEDIGEDYYYSDMYYAGLDSIWDPNGNGIYGENGEEDFTADVFVGRLPVSNVSEADLAVERIISYERDITPGNWQNRCLMAAGLMTAPNNSTEYNGSKDNSYKAVQYALPFASKVLDVNVMADYPQLAGGNYTLAGDGLDRAGFIQAFEQGAAVVSFTGQAFYQTNLLYGNSLAQYQDPLGITPYHFEPLLDPSDARGLKNGNMLPLAFFATCDSGNYTESDDSNMEMLWKDTEGGVIGLIASTGHSYRGEEEGGSFGNWWLEKKFYMELSDGNTRQGELLYTMLADYYTGVVKSSRGSSGGRAIFPRELGKMNLYGYTLLGDPETDIYLEPAGALDVASGPVYVGNNTVSVTVSDHGSGPLKDALVCLSSDALGVYARGRTDSTGSVELQVSPGGTGTLSMVVTAHDRQASVGTVPVTQEPPDLVVSSSDILPRDAVPSDTITTQVSVTVHNAGQSAAGAFDVLLSGGALGNDPIGTRRITALEPGGSSTLVFDWTPAGGSNILSVTVDPDNAVSESHEDNNAASFPIVVNTAPRFGAIPAVIVEEDLPPTQVLDLKEYVTDASNERSELQFTLEQVSEASLGLSVNRTGEVWMYPMADWYGNGSARVSVSDGMASDSVSIEFRVNGVNDPPRIDSIANQSVRLNQRFTIMISANDPDGDTLTFSDDTDLFDIDPVTGIIAFTEYEREGIFNVTITVSDPFSSTSEMVTFIVGMELRILEPEAPLVATEGSAFEYRVEVANAPAGDPLIFSDDSGMFDMDPDNGSIRFTPSSSDVGTDTFVVSVTDSVSNMTDTHTFTIEVREKSVGSISVFTIGLLVFTVLVLAVLVVARLVWKKFPTDGDTDPDDTEVDEAHENAPGAGQKEGKADGKRWDRHSGEKEESENGKEHRVSGKRSSGWEKRKPLSGRSKGTRTSAKDGESAHTDAGGAGKGKRPRLLRPEER